MRGFWCVTLTVCAAIPFGGTAVGQQITWTVTFNDPGATQSAYYGQLDSHIQAAGQRWGQFLQPASNVNVAVQVTFDTNVARATGASVASSQVGIQNGVKVFEQGVATLVRTGTDVNNAAPDMLLRINPTYLQNGLGFDADPFARTGTPNAARTDAVSVMLHEIGHALGFNGFRSGTDGTLPGDSASTFDQHVTFDGSNLYFNGPNAKGLYGGNPVPLTFGNYAHLGNASPRPGQDLVNDLMTGGTFANGVRYDISPLDRAILLDAGVTLTPVPEPSAAVLVGGLFAAGLAWRGRRDRG